MEEISEVPIYKCGGLIRPDVVWFGEYLPVDQFNASEKAAYECDLFFVVGTSAVVYPAASLIFTAKQQGAIIIQINIKETEMSSFVYKTLTGEAGTLLPQILSEIKS
jgi:NAD-dependent deacetylase